MRYIVWNKEENEEAKEETEKNSTRENFIYLKTVWLANESLESSQVNERKTSKQI